MEHGKLGRQEFMREIAEMTKHIVKKAKEYDHDTVPGDYATLETPCPNCGGVVKENYRRYTCTGKPGDPDGCGFSFGKTPAGRTFELAEVEQLLRDKKVGPLDGFRSKAGWPFTSEIVLKYDEDKKNWKLEFDFGNTDGDDGEPVDFSGQEPLGICPKSGGRIFESGSNYVCEHAVPTAEQPTPTCDFKSRKIILQQPVARDQMSKLLETGKTDLLEGFVSNRTRRPFKAYLAWDKEAGKVNFEFAPSKFPGRKKPFKRAASPEPAAAKRAPAVKAGRKAAATKTPRTERAPAAKRTSVRKVGPGLKPSHELAAVIGEEPVARTEVIKKLWAYIKDNGLQDATNKRAINADARLLPLFGKPQVSMFEIAGLVGKHLS
jgi:DNA topoisomerase III